MVGKLKHVLWCNSILDCVTNKQYCTLKLFDFLGVINQYFDGSDSHIETFSLNYRIPYLFFAIAQSKAIPGPRYTNQSLLKKVRDLKVSPTIHMNKLKYQICHMFLRNSGNTS